MTTPNDVDGATEYGKQWISEKLTGLLSEDERMSTLNALKKCFKHLPPPELGRCTQMLQLPLIFDCLNDSNVEQIDLTCEVLTVCLNNLTLGESTNRHNVLLERALKHPLSQVKIMALNDIQRNIVNDELLQNFSKHVPLLNAVILCIGNDDLSVAKLACDVITNVGVSENCIKVLLSEDVKKAISEVMAVNEVVRLRFYEVFLNIARQSETSSNALESSGFLNQILGDLDNNDILLRMNIVELYSQFVKSEAGYKYLQKNGIMKKFCDQMKNSDDELFIELCEPGILKFFGELAHWKPYDLTTKHAYILRRIVSNISSDNFVIVGVSFDTIGHIAQTNEGKLALHSTENTIPTLLPLIVETLTKLPNEIKIRALNCIENMLEVSTDDSRITDITKDWFLNMGPNPMDFILKYAKNPFEELRSAGMGILKALATQTWGQQVIQNSPGLIEFILDRNVETIKDCQLLKYDIIKNLYKSDVFNQNVKSKLQEFIERGRFYVQGVTEVATERND